MAAIFYTSPIANKTIFKNGMSINNSARLPFLANIIGPNSMLIMTEIMIQNRDTIQYFLTFDDFISFFYFGKGLGSLTVNGMIFSDVTGYFGGLQNLMNLIGIIRGTAQNISFGNMVITGVLSAFTLRSSSDINSLNFVDFNLQFDIVDHSLPPPTFNPSC